MTNGDVKNGSIFCFRKGILNVQGNVGDVVHRDFSKALAKMNDILAGKTKESETDHRTVIGFIGIPMVPSKRHRC